MLIVTLVLLAASLAIFFGVEIALAIGRRRKRHQIRIYLDGLIKRDVQ